jgi:catechol 2,3-dioxygenase-like lactoylglutathione lyase family enzyme
MEWNDFSIVQAGAGRPVTAGLHIAFVAGSREAMEAFWRAGDEAGYRDDGLPGPRPQYGPDYEGAFLLDPDGNSAEATFHGDVRAGRRIDHLWIRVADLAASRRFYTAVAEALHFAEVEHLSERTRHARSRRRHVLRRRRSGDHSLAPGAFVLDPDGHNVEAVHHGR